MARSGAALLTPMLAASAVSSRIGHDAERGPSRRACAWPEAGRIGACACCWRAAIQPGHDQQRRHRSGIRVGDVEGRDAVDPHHRRRRVADDAARIRRRSRPPRWRRGSQCAPCGNTISATVAPMSAAAMLSRNDDSTKTSASNAKPPIDAGGSTRGSGFGHAARPRSAAPAGEAGQQQAEVGDDRPTRAPGGCQPGQSRPFTKRAERAPCIAAMTAGRSRRRVACDDGRARHRQREREENESRWAFGHRVSAADHRPGGQVCDYTHAGS